MPRSIPPPLAFCLTTLRLNAGWSQGELARAHGLSAALLSLYENGKKTLTRRRLEELISPLAAGPDDVERTLLYVETQRGEAPEPPGSPFELTPSERRQL